ncbi:hypothetical protein I3760_07G123300 [Carya illinoinensis]|nr:hypothetical protein I3760_07G123300 [Carya illinoinensis]
MENEPFLSSQTRPQLQPILEDRDVSSSFIIPHSQDPTSSSTSQLDAPNTHVKRPGSLHRCKTAPAMAVMRDLKSKTPQIPKPQSDSSSIIRPQHGFSARDYIFDAAKGRMRIRLKVGLALGVVVLCIGMGTLVLYFVEDLDWIDSVYLSVMSVTTVGYGDRAFKTLPGRLFASIWLLFSTLMVARAFLYLAEARIDKRHRRIASWVLQRDITVEDLLAADVNNNGFISKSEYVIYKLKEMGKIGEKDVLQICDHFSKLDPNNSGKITLPYLLQNRL